MECQGPRCSTEVSTADCTSNCVSRSQVSVAGPKKNWATVEKSWLPFEFHANGTVVFCAFFCF